MATARFLALTGGTGVEGCREDASPGWLEGLETEVTVAISSWTQATSLLCHKSREISHEIRSRNSLGDATRMTPES